MIKNINGTGFEYQGVCGRYIKGHFSGEAKKCQNRQLLLPQHPSPDKVRFEVAKKMKFFKNFYFCLDRDLQL